MLGLIRKYSLVHGSESFQQLMEKEAKRIRDYNIMMQYYYDSYELDEIKESILRITEKSKGNAE